MTKSVAHISELKAIKQQFKWDNIFFLGIGGIGMSALARYFYANEFEVSGYDKTATDLTRTLEASGISIHYQDSVSNIEYKYLDSDKTLVIYTPAIPKENQELNYFKDNNYTLLKRSEVLGLITEKTKSLAVAGTHGKTTTSCILGHLLNVCNEPLTAFLGGISENYNSNLILKGSEISVVEADEFDRSFLTLSPDIACITSMDADHLDIYGSEEALHKSFRDFKAKLKPNGVLYVKKGLPIEGITYGVEDGADVEAINVQISKGYYLFDVKINEDLHTGFKFALPGRHNLSNALVAIAMAIHNGCDIEKIKEGLISFTGVQRRFSYKIKQDDLVYIDDYAHHPSEIEAIHQAVREMYPNEKVMVAFQPHLFTRTQDFVDGFAESLSKFDEVALLDIYPARELPIEGVTSSWLLNKMTLNNKRLVAKGDLVNAYLATDATVLLTLGAGDIGAEVALITKALKNAN